MSFPLNTIPSVAIAHTLLRINTQLHPKVTQINNNGLQWFSNGGVYQFPLRYSLRNNISVFQGKRVDQPFALHCFQRHYFSFRMHFNFRPSKSLHCVSPLPILRSQAPNTAITRLIRAFFIHTYPRPVEYFEINTYQSQLMFQEMHLWQISLNGIN